MYPDFHIHTSFSSDSETDPECQIQKAISLGMDTICLTDHQDFDFPPGEYDFLFDTDAYFQKLAVLKETYQKQIRLCIGVELGLQPHLKQQLPEYVSRYLFDFVIGSTHVSRRLDPYEKEFFEGLSEERAYRLYFEEELENLKTYDCYDVAGHIDYVVRYGPTKAACYSYAKQKDVLDEILRTLIDKGKGLECNTSGLRSGLDFPNPHPDLLRRYREMGGEILTLGSDAHAPANIGEDFQRMKELLIHCGFRYYTIFQNRKPEFRSL